MIVNNSATKIYSLSSQHFKKIIQVCELRLLTLNI